jgi:hypothetical protein
LASVASMRETLIQETMPSLRLRELRELPGGGNADIGGVNSNEAPSQTDKLYF